MSFLNPDFLADLKKEQIIGIVTNAYRLDIASGKFDDIYLPYNMILTNNFLFGEHLSTPPISFDRRMVFDKLANKDEAFASIETGISKGKIVKGMGETSNKIDVKLEYGKINKVKIDNWFNGGSYIQGLKDFSTSFEFYLGLFGLNMLFITDKELSNGIVELLNKTELSNKISK